MSQSTLSSQSHMFMTTFQARPGGHVVACAVPPAHWWYTWQLPGSGKWPWRYHCISAPYGCQEIVFRAGNEVPQSFVKLRKGSFPALVSCHLAALAGEVVRGGGDGGHVQVLVPVRARDAEQSVQGGGSEGG